MKALSTISLNYSLLSIPIRVYPLRDTKEDKLAFCGLSKCCRSELKLKKLCKNCDNEVPFVNDLKGYKVSKNNFIELSKDELDTIERIDNGIEILYFIKANELSLLSLDKPYFLEPTNAYKVYELFTNIFAELSIYAIVRATIKGSEHFGIVRHDKSGLVLQFIERVTDLTIEIKKVAYSEAEQKQLKELILSNLKEFDFSDLKPIYVTKVKELIQNKAEGKVIALKPIETSELQESNLLNVLKQMSKEKIVKEIN